MLFSIQVKDDEEEEEDLSDTGRIFIRNLSYTCTEADLENLFCKYGNLVEINLPIDKNSKKMTGYAFVTYMFPEHAIKAFMELDRTVFQGRTLYLVPGKSKKSKAGDNEKGKLVSFISVQLPFILVLFSNLHQLLQNGKQ